MALLMDDAALQTWQRALVRSAGAAANCSIGAFRRRTDTWVRVMSEVVSGTAAERVGSAYVPCGGVDALGALGVFPGAQAITLVSREPALPTGLTSFPHSHALSAPDLTDAPRATTATAHQIYIPRVLLKPADGDVIGCLRVVGGYNMGHLLRRFADDGGNGILPALLAILGAAGVTITNLRNSSRGRLAGISMACQMRKRRFTLRYIQADLSDGAQLEELRVFERRGPENLGSEHLGSERHGPRQYEKHGADARGRGRGRGRLEIGSSGGSVAGALIKGAEACFRPPGSDPPVPKREALGRHVLRVASVLVQDTQSGIRWPVVERWADSGGLLPLGSLITIPGIDRVQQGTLMGGGMRSLWMQSPRWRSLRGQRFGYCHGRVDLSRAGSAWAAAMAARTHPQEPVAKGDVDDGERGQSFHCAALLAWNREALVLGAGAERKIEGAGSRIVRESGAAPWSLPTLLLRLEAFAVCSLCFAAFLALRALHGRCRVGSFRTRRAPVDVKTGKTERSK